MKKKTKKTKTNMNKTAIKVNLLTALGEANRISDATIIRKPTKLRMEIIEELTKAIRNALDELDKE